MSLELTPRNGDELHQLHTTFSIGEEIFRYRLIPRDFKNPELLFANGKKEAVLDFFPRVIEGLQYQTRLDDPNYPSYIDDRRYIASALEATATRQQAVQDIEALLHEAFGNYHANLAWPDNLNAVGGEDGLSKEIENDEQLLYLPKDIMPMTHHTLITLGILNRLPAEELPYIDRFPFIARNMWGQNLTIDRIRTIIEQMEQTVRKSLQPYQEVSEQALVPVAQFFQVGKNLSKVIPAWPSSTF